MAKEDLIKLLERVLPYVEKADIFTFPEFRQSEILISDIKEAIGELKEELHQ